MNNGIDIRCLNCDPDGTWFWMPITVLWDNPDYWDVVICCHRCQQPRCITRWGSAHLPSGPGHSWRHAFKAVTDWYASYAQILHNTGGGK